MTPETGVDWPGGGVGEERERPDAGTGALEHGIASVPSTVVFDSFSLDTRID